MSDFAKFFKKELEEGVPYLRKAMIIGLGGSGISCLGSVKKYMAGLLPPEASEYIRWIGIDTTDPRSSIEGEGADFRYFDDPEEVKNQSGYYKKILYIPALTKELESLYSKIKSEDPYTEKFFKWFPNPKNYDMSVMAGQGANQQRALGRLAFYQNFSYVKNALLEEKRLLEELPVDTQHFKMLDASQTVNEKGEIEKDAKVTIMITGSVVGGTCCGMFLDVSAFTQSLFIEAGKAYNLYGIYVLPQAFDRFVDSDNSFANAYSALKELDYYMSGKLFEADYPEDFDGFMEGKLKNSKDWKTHHIKLDRNLFGQGRLYLMDKTNLEGISLQGRDQVQQLTAQLIQTFVASKVGGQIEERLVNDAGRTAGFRPLNTRVRRNCCYNSFGISRIVLPVEEMTEMGKHLISIEVLKKYLQEPDEQLLLETLGDIKRGLISDLRLDPRIFFDKLYPDYEPELNDIEFPAFVSKFKGMTKSEIFEEVNILYDDNKDLTKMGKTLKRTFDREWTKEKNRLAKLFPKTVIDYMQDPNRGVAFASMVCDIITKIVRDFYSLYYDSSLKVKLYSAEELSALLEKYETSKGSDLKTAKKIYEMIKINYIQTFFKNMLEYACVSCDEYIMFVDHVKQDLVESLKEKLAAVKQQEEMKYDGLLNKLVHIENPLFKYTVKTQQEIDDFIDKYIFSKIDIDIIAKKLNFYDIDKADDADQAKAIIEYYEKAGAKLDGVDLTNIDELIKKADEDSIITKEQMKLLEISVLGKALKRTVDKALKNLSFGNLNIKDILKEQNRELKIELSEIYKKSRPYIMVNKKLLKSNKDRDPGKLASLEYFRTVSTFKLNSYEDDKKAASGQPQMNDMPECLDHVSKRKLVIPEVVHECITVGHSCSPFEVKTIGLLISFPLFALDSLKRSHESYHRLINGTTPLHLWNGGAVNARYFPDPFKEKNFINPKELWTGLNYYKILKEEKDREKFIYSPEYRMEIIRTYLKKFVDSKKMGERDRLSTLIELGKICKILWENPDAHKGDRWGFIDPHNKMVKDILCDDTLNRAKKKGLTYAQYLDSLPNPVFENIDGFIEKMIEEPRMIKYMQQALQIFFKKRIEKGDDKKRTIYDDWLDVEFYNEEDFYSYYLKNGTFEWQNYFKTVMVEKVMQELEDPKFKDPHDPTKPNLSGIRDYLKKLTEKNLPEIVLWEVQILKRLLK